MTKLLSFVYVTFPSANKENDLLIFTLTIFTLLLFFSQVLIRNFLLNLSKEMIIINALPMTSFHLCMFTGISININPRTTESGSI